MIYWNLARSLCTIYILPPHLLRHAKEIISVDVYGDTQEIIEDCLDVLEPFIEEVIPKERKDQYYDYSEVIEIDLILEEYFHAA